ncbi:hypothetical protein ACFC18_30045 [Streptomyces sp. NPDC056121]|uniref:hypothetical protein n=1 Tax=Streptomyces sp. NPDC056121 TaxID=3345718 RepID=UPI0035E24B81
MGHRPLPGPGRGVRHGAARHRRPAPAARRGPGVPAAGHRSPRREFYDAASKLDADARGTVSVALADLPAPVLDQLTQHATTLWDGLSCRSAARIDFMVTDNGTVYALEVNTTPGMSRESNFVTGAALCGLDCRQVLRASALGARILKGMFLTALTAALQRADRVIRDSLAGR